MPKPSQKGHGLSDAKICDLLDADLAVGDIVACRSGKINRAHYAAKLGCTPSALTRFRDIFEQYEKRENIKTGPRRHIEEIRKRLILEYNAGHLNLRNGKINRAEALKRLGHKGNSSALLLSEVREIFDELDAQAKIDNYLPKLLQGELQALKSALADRPSLNKDRISIDLAELTKKTGITKARLLREPFHKLLADQQRKTLENAKASRIDPFIHGRVFPFSILCALWPPGFLERIGIRFKQFAPSYPKTSIKRPYLELVRMLDWIGSSSNPKCRQVVEGARSHNKITSSEEWEDALFIYRDHLVARERTGEISATYVDSSIKSLRMILRPLASAGILPETSNELIGVKFARRKGGRLKSVAEATSTKSRETSQKYIIFAKEHLQKLAQDNDLHLGSKGAEAFCASLENDPSRPFEKFSNIAEAIKFTLENRVQALQKRAEETIEEAKSALDLGNDLLKTADIDIGAFEKAYLNPRNNGREKSNLVRKFFPDPASSDEAQVRRGTGNLLKFIEYYYNRSLPAIPSTTTGPYGAFFAKRLTEYGGVSKIEPLIGPAPDAVAAALTLYLIGSGANLGVGRNLRKDCLERSDRERHWRITGTKTRAKGKPIITELPENSPSIRAIRWLLSIRGQSMGYVNKGSEGLFMVRMGSRYQLMSEHWYTSWFKKFAAKIPDLRGIELAPSMIRPSVLLLAALSNEGRLMVGIAQGQHSVSVGQGYQQKWPTRVIYDQNIRRFQLAFETLIMSGVEDAASKLGISIEQFNDRLSDLRATGLGTFCKDKLERPEAEHAPCRTLDCWNECPHLVIVAEVEAIALLQLWQTSLREVRSEWERDRPERWEQVWLPWLCLTDVVEEKMVRGTMIKVWKSAQKRAGVIAATAGYVPPRPW